jgi:hypothetical protein
MRRLYALLTLIVVVVFIAWVSSDNTVVTKPPPTAPFKSAGEFPLSGVEGRIDHLGVDVPGMRLFIAALGNNTVEVLSLKDGKRLHTIIGLKQPQGILYLPQINRLIVSCAADGACKIFDGSSYELLHTAKFEIDADNMRFDSTSGLVYVGYGQGALGVFDPQTGTVDSTKEIALHGHPESFQFDPSNPDIFVNVPDARQIAVASRDTHTALIARRLINDIENYPMALDKVNRRLFIGCRSPAKLLVMELSEGLITTRYSCVSDADDVFYDAARKRVYVNGGDGYISTFEQQTPDKYAELPKVKTASGGRTSLFVPELNTLYVAIPHQDNHAAMIKVFEVK